MNESERSGASRRPKTFTTRRAQDARPAPDLVERNFEVAGENHLRTELVQQALDMALWQRRPSDVIHHSDQGCQYTSIVFGLRCREANVRPSMGSVGDCFDNAMCESFFATLECELLVDRRFRTQAEAKVAVFDLDGGDYSKRPLSRHAGRSATIGSTRDARRAGR